MNKISCIVCAYNEETRITTVLRALKKAGFDGEIIVVNDGSSDHTSEVVEAEGGVRLIEHPVNKGKSTALATGITHAKHDILMLIDADLIGLDKEAIDSLLEPVLSGRSDAALSLRKNSMWLYRLIGIDFVSGERVIKKELLIGKLEEIKKLPGYGIETFMNRLIIAQSLRLTIVKWDRVRITPKSSKVGFWKGLTGELKMIRQILKMASPAEIIYQNYALLKLSRKAQDAK